MLAFLLIAPAAAQFRPPAQAQVAATIQRGAKVDERTWSTRDKARRRIIRKVEKDGRVAIIRLIEFE